MKLSKLKLNPNNPRTISDDDMEKLKESIQNLPKMMELRPIIYDEEFVILGGNMRYQALLALGNEEVPDSWVKCATGLTEAEKREFIVKDNVGFGEWNFDELGNEYTPEELRSWGMEKIDFESNKETVEVRFSASTNEIECPECGHTWQK